MLANESGDGSAWIELLTSLNKLSIEEILKIVEFNSKLTNIESSVSSHFKPTYSLKIYQLIET